MPHRLPAITQCGPPRHPLSAAHRVLLLGAETRQEVIIALRLGVE